MKSRAGGEAIDETTEGNVAHEPKQSPSFVRHWFFFTWRLQTVHVNTVIL